MEKGTTSAIGLKTFTVGIMGYFPEGNNLDEVQHKGEGSCKAQRTIKMFLIYSPSGVEPLY